MAIPVRPRWIPTSFEQAKIDIPALRPSESKYLEFKSELPRAEKTSKVIASLANESGTLIIGIEEDKDTQVATGINRISIKGVPEQIQQIVGQLDPVLTIEEPILLADPDDPSTGIVVVNVPVSPTAPHMANGKYHKRSGAVTEEMTDSEIQELMFRRKADAARATDHFPVEDARLASPDSIPIWVAAVPRAVRNEQLLAGAIGTSSDARKWIADRLQSADEALQKQIEDADLNARLQGPGLAGTFRHANTTRRAGYVRMRRDFKGWVKPVANEQPVPEVNLLELGESGSAGMFANYLIQRRYRAEDPRIFQWRQALGFVYATVLLSNELVSSVGLQADIDVAVRVNGLEGSFPEEPAGLQGSQADWQTAERDPIIDRHYEAQTTWSFAELKAGSLEPMYRLFGPLLRSMNLDDFRTG
jgi:hypothetical protein